MDLLEQSSSLNNPKSSFTLLRALSHRPPIRMQNAQSNSGPDSPRMLY